jgi:peroxiredoxin
MVGKFRVMFALAAALVLVTTNGYAALEIGDAGPDWSGLQGVDDKAHSLSDYAKAKAVVVVFTCNHCPVAVAYEDRLIALQSDYKAKGVQLIAINSNSPEVQPGDSFEKMKQRAQSKGFNFPYLVDATQQVARDYGATCTPHVFVLDKARKVAYTGNVDDNQRNPEEATPNLRNALDAVLAGKPADPAKTRQFGCSVKWKKK